MEVSLRSRPRDRMIPIERRHVKFWQDWFDLRLTADSLGYLSIRGVLAALELPYDRFCFACFDGNYPEPVPYDAASRKFILEETSSEWRRGAPPSASVR